VAFLVLLVFSTACSSSNSSSTSQISDLNNPDYSAIVFTVDLALGTNRIVFGLIDRDGLPFRSDEAEVQALYLQPDRTTEEVRDTAIAKFIQWPTGEQGVFSTNIEFDMTGIWQLNVRAFRDDGTFVEARGAVQVNEQSSTPAIGDRAPASKSPTIDSLVDISTISSANAPDPDLYRISIDRALEVEKPIVLVFASPAFCTSATCGPQVQVISEVKNRYKTEANFIHVEVFENPNLFQSGRPLGGVVPAVEEWGLPTEPWTFVIDCLGLVQAKFEQFTTADEIDAALNKVLCGKGLLQ
jgi:hypothetical protein